MYDYGELFSWSTRLWQLFLLKSWAVLLIVVVRIRDEILPRFQTPCLLNYQTEKFQKAICSSLRKSRHRAAYTCKSTPQPLIEPHGPGPAAARSGAYRFEPEIVKKAEMQGAVSGCSCWLFRWSRRCRSKTRQQWLVGYIILFWRKECLNTPRPVHHELAVTVSPRCAHCLRQSGTHDRSN